MNLHPCPLCGESKGYKRSLSLRLCCKACEREVGFMAQTYDGDDAAWNAAAAHAQGLRDRIAELEAQLARDELSPEFTDTSRAALLWVLWHHQGGSSPVGQPLRFALGMGAHDHLNENQIAEAKRWAEISGSTTADFHKHRELEAQRVPLTDEQITAIFMTYGTGRSDGFNAAVQAVERAHGIARAKGQA